MMKRILTLLFLFTSCFSISQVTVIDMPSNSQQRFSGCSYALFNDSGSAGANYSNGENGQIIFCPSIPTDRMQIDFRQMDIGAGDILTIHDGDDNTFPVLAIATNTTMPLGLIQASPANPNGCLFITFTSDNNNTNNFGWRAERGCFDPCQAISPVIVTTPAYDPTDDILRICQGQTVTFDGSANFSVDGSGATYEWDLGNGNGLNPGQIQTETYNTSGIYQVQFIVTDILGCKDRNAIDLTVFVSTDPDFTGTQAADTQLCFGESTDLTGVVNAVNFAISPSPPVTGRTFLPDGSGVSYTTCIDVDLFPVGATFNNASDLLNAFIEIEHSYMGDLEIKLISPTGASVTFLFYPNSGNGTYLGNALDDGTTVPGVGFLYTFTEVGTATQTLDQATAGVGGGVPIPAGDYLPEEPFSNFIGSPLNGNWCIEITDNLSIDNGYIFQWGLNFNPSIIPGDLSFTPGITTEQWVADPSITATNGNVITVTPAIAGQNCYTFEFFDSFGCTYTEQVCIDVTPEILSAAPNDILVCNTTGSTTVDLTENDPVILNTLLAGDHNISYHRSLTDAENGVGAITNVTAFPITMPPMTLFSAITNTTSNCTVTDSFIVDIIDFSTFNIPDYEQCGPIVNFDLDAYVSAALSGGGSGSSNFTLSYYTSLSDAQNETNPIINPNMFNLPAGTVTIHVRIVSVTDPACNSINPFSITAAVIPIANTPMDMITCDDITNDGQDIFVLSNQDMEVLNGQTATVTYHLTPLDALNAAAPLNAAGYQNISNPQTVYARVTDTSSLMCFSTTQFDLVVNRRAVYTVVNDIVVCDDLSNDGIDQFDLTTQNTAILGTQIAADNTITFYNSQVDADAGINAIATPAAYTNATTGMETVFVRIENNTATDCYGTGDFDLIINVTPTANPVVDVVVCDDPSNDGIDVFVFDNNTAQVMLAQDPLLFTVSYHDSQADADSGSTPLDPTAYTNTSNPQTIYIRIENANDATCFNTTDFDLIINESPRIIAASDLTLCDDPSGDGIESFDLTLNDTVILNGLNPADYTIVYSNSTGVITAPFSNTGSPETITVSVQNNLTTCFDTTTFDLIVSPVPVTVASFVIEECDEDGDGVASFILGDANAQIINGQTRIAVTYHDSQTDALTGLNPLDTAAYDNISAPQTIFYRIEFTASGCFSIADFIIEPVDAPIAVVPTALEACDDGSGNATVDVSLANMEVTTGQVGSLVAYYLNQTDADDQVNGITSNFTYSSNTTLIVRVDDDTTDCFSFTTLDVVFNALPAPFLLDQYILCIDENGNLVNGPVTLDTELNNADFSFEWSLDGSVIAASTASVDVVEGGDYEVTATRISSGCENTETTNVRISSIPDIYDIDITTDPFDKEHQVIVTAEGPDQYWYRLDDGPYVNSGIFKDVSPGPHTVTIAERSGCGEIVADIFVFGYPDYFTPNADGIHDTWNLIGGELLPGTKLYIFDRYGKLIKQLNVDGIGWDGTFNGQPMPSSDYWFRIEYSFNGSQREASGHFAMKR